MTGYLTTVTSDEENRFVSDRARANVIGAACAVPAGATLVNCIINTNPIGGEQGDRFASIRIKEDPTGS